jgi:hypothetical protein
MVKKILADLIVEVPEMFDLCTEEELSQLVEEYLLNHQQGKGLVAYTGVKGKFYRIIQRHAKYRKPVVTCRKLSPEQKKLSVKAAVKKYQAKPQYKIAHALRRRTYQVLKGRNKSFKTLDLLGCTVEALMEHLSLQFVEGMSWDNYGEWHIDHIKPLCSVDVTDTEQLKTVSHYTNLRPLWKKDNLAKVKEDVKQSYKKRDR